MIERKDECLSEENFIEIVNILLLMKTLYSARFCNTYRNPFFSSNSMSCKIEVPSLLTWIDLKMCDCPSSPSSNALNVQKQYIEILKQKAIPYEEHHHSYQ